MGQGAGMEQWEALVLRECAGDPQIAIQLNMWVVGAQQLPGASHHTRANSTGSDSLRSCLLLFLSFPALVMSVPLKF